MVVPSRVAAASAAYIGIPTVCSPRLQHARVLADPSSFPKKYNVCVGSDKGEYFRSFFVWRIRVATTAG